MTTGKKEAGEQLAPWTNIREEEHIAVHPVSCSSQAMTQMQAFTGFSNGQRATS